MIRWLLCLALAILPLLGCQVAATEKEDDPSVPDVRTDRDQGGIFEIRNYHFRPDQLDAYRAWANEEAIPYLGQHVDIVGFWFGTEVPAEVSGAPLDELGSANVTWIIRWDDMEQRAEGMAATFSTEEWADIYSRVPGGRDSYLRIEARFMESAERPGSVLGTPRSTR